MVKIELEGLTSEYHEGVDLSQVEPYNDPRCKHEIVDVVDDEMEGVIAYRCRKCMVGWLVKKPSFVDKIKEKES